MLFVCVFFLSFTNVTRKKKEASLDKQLDIFFFFRNMTINRSWLDGIWHGWGHTSFTWPVQLTVDSMNNTYVLVYVGLGGKSRLERLEELDDKIYFREHLIEGDGFSDQDLFVITKIDDNHLEFLAFNDQTTSDSDETPVVGGMMNRQN